MSQNRFRVYLGVLWLMTSWLLACTAPEDKEPEGLIDKERMANVLAEVHLNEARISRLGLSSIDSSNMVYKHLEAGFLKKFGVDTASYRKSYIFYSSHPRDMVEIYNKVTQKLQKQLDSARAKHL